MVLLTALIRVLYAQFRRPVDIVTSGPWSEPLLRGQPGVGEIFSMRSRKTPYWLSSDQRRVVAQLRARGPGPTWFCDGNDAARPLLERAGIPEDFIVAAKDHDLRPGEHACEQWRRLAQIMPRAGAAEVTGAAGAAGATGATGATRVASAAGADAMRLAEDGDRAAAVAAVAPGCYLKVGDAQRADLRAWLDARGLHDQPLLLLQIGNKRTMRRGFKRLAVNHKHWPAERWAEVLAFLRRQHPRHAIVLLGASPEYHINRQLAELANVSGVFNAADDLPIPRLVALLERGCGLITVDSGPAHAAAAVGCPQVVLFGRASPALYRPWGTAGADVMVVRGEIDGQPNMLGITPASVIEAFRALKLRDAAS
jgi:heptosyltransferase-2/heptosyltransferase-3